jgi:hypothetical protein
MLAAACCESERMEAEKNEIPGTSRSHDEHP